MDPEYAEASYKGVDNYLKHMSYNVAGTYLPGQTPVFLEHPDPDDMQAIRRPAGWA